MHASAYMEQFRIPSGGKFLFLCYTGIRLKQVIVKIVLSHTLTAGAGKAIYKYVKVLEGNLICPFVLQLPPAAVQPPRQPSRVQRDAHERQRWPHGTDEH